MLRLIATSGDQLDLLALANKYAVGLIGPPLSGLVKENGDNFEITNDILVIYKQKEDNKI